MEMDSSESRDDRVARIVMALLSFIHENRFDRSDACTAMLLAVGTYAQAGRLPHAEFERQVNLFLKESAVGWCELLKEIDQLEAEAEIPHEQG